MSSTVAGPRGDSRPGCPGRARHWRIAFGTVGMRTPVCVYCGSPNPVPLSDDEWAQIIDLASLRSVGDHVRTAIEERSAVTRG